MPDLGGRGRKAAEHPRKMGLDLERCVLLSPARQGRVLAELETPLALDWRVINFIGAGAMSTHISDIREFLHCWLWGWAMEGGGCCGVRGGLEGPPELSLGCGALCLDSGRSWSGKMEFRRFKWEGWEKKAFE